MLKISKKNIEEVRFAGRYLHFNARYQYILNIRIS